MLAPYFFTLRIEVTYSLESLALKIREPFCCSRWLQKIFKKLLKNLLTNLQVCGKIRMCQGKGTNV